eukprot:g11286.t1
MLLLHLILCASNVALACSTVHASVKSPAKEEGEKGKKIARVRPLLTQAPNNTTAIAVVSVFHHNHFVDPSIMTTAYPIASGESKDAMSLPMLVTWYDSTGKTSSKTGMKQGVNGRSKGMGKEMAEAENGVLKHRVLPGQQSLAPMSIEELKSHYVAKEQAFLEADESDRLDCAGSSSVPTKSGTSPGSRSSRSFFKGRYGSTKAEQFGPLVATERTLILQAGLGLLALHVAAQASCTIHDCCLIVLVALMNPLRTVSLGYMTGRSLRSRAMSPPACILQESRFWNASSSGGMSIWFRSIHSATKCAARLPDSHPLARKWPAARFNGLLKDVDELVNVVWGSCLNIFQKMVSIMWTLGLMFIALKGAHKEGEELWYTFGICIMLVASLAECENMVRAGQMVYFSASEHAVTVGRPYDSTLQPPARDTDGQEVPLLQADFEQLYQQGGQQNDDDNQRGAYREAPTPANRLRP